MPYPATAQTFTPVKFLKIDFEKLQKVIYTNPTLSLKIQASLIKKIKNLEKVISSDIVLDAKQRVAKYICENNKIFFIQKNVEIAEILNITPETLSRILKLFKQKQLINMQTKTIDHSKLSEYF